MYGINGGRSSAVSGFVHPDISVDQERDGQGVKQGQPLIRATIQQGDTTHGDDTPCWNGR